MLARPVGTAAGPLTPPRRTGSPGRVRRRTLFGSRLP